jgi:hypothetical protein
MRNLLRAFAACALALTALSTVNASTVGSPTARCSIYCFSSHSSISVTTTQEECCGQEFPGKCPDGGTGIGIRWNGQLC